MSNKEKGAAFLKPYCQKTLTIVCVLGFMLLAEMNAQTTPIPVNKCYDIKSCRIVYTFFNGLERGDKIRIFDDWGAFEKIVAKTKLVKDSIEGDSIVSKIMKARAKDTNILMLRNRAGSYIIDLDKKEGVFYSLLGCNPEIPDNVGRLVGKDTILGKPCDVMEMPGFIKVWLWNKLVLKKQLTQKVDGITVEEYAILIDENYKIQEGDFNLPTDVKFK